MRLFDMLLGSIHLSERGTIVGLVLATTVVAIGCGSKTLIISGNPDAAVIQPDVTPADTTTPDAATPDTAMPDTATPDTATPDTTTPDTAMPDTKTEKSCAADECTIETQCYANGSSNPANPCQQCLVIANAVDWTGKDGTACDDGSACTISDHCEDGTCAGKPRDCGDTNACTADSCNPETGCVYVDIAEECKDDNLCTNDSCDPTLGCQNTYNTSACNDGNACTSGDSCNKGKCTGNPVDVDDKNSCTDDGCDPIKGTYNLPNSLPCNDGNVCTLGDVCLNGSCSAGGDTPNCADTNPCTTDGCDPTTGCINTANTLPCTDSDSCTVNDTCNNNSCSGTPKKCNDYNTCTADSCSNGACQNDLIPSDACRPKFTSVYPARGATLKQSSSIVTVSGTVKSGASSITSLTINGDPVSVDVFGKFNHDVIAVVGGNILVFEATDGFDTTRKRVQSFLYSAEYLKPTSVTLLNGTAEPGIGVFLAQSVLDDGVHTMSDPDDIATLFEMILNDFDLAGTIPSDVPVGSAASYDIYVKNLADSYRTVELNSEFGVIKMKATIFFPLNGKAADIEAKSWLPDKSGELFLDRIEITADITADVVNHNIVADVDNIDVQVYGLDVSMGWLVDWIINFFEDNITNKVEVAFESEIGAQIKPLIADAFQGLGFQTTLNLASIDPTAGGTSIDLSADPSDISVYSSGVTVKMRVGAYGSNKAPYYNKGVPRRNGCGFGGNSLYVPTTKPIVMAISDDTANLLLHAAWKSGLLEFDAPTWMVGTNDLLADGVSDLSIHLSGMLAPTLSDCAAGSDLLVHIGDLRTDIDLKLLGQPASLSIYTSLKAKITFAVESGGGGSSCPAQCGDYVVGASCQCDGLCSKYEDCCDEYQPICVDGNTPQTMISVWIQDVVELENEIVVDNDELIALEPVIAAMLETQIIPSILDSVTGETVGGFPIPAIDVGLLMEGIPAGTVITLDSQEVDHYAGKVVIKGDVQ